jgi:flagellar protein FlaF
MGFSVSTSYALIGLAVLAAFGTGYTVVSTSADRVTDATEDHLDRVEQVGATDISVTDVEYDFVDGVLTVNITNTGSTQLSVGETDVLLDGEYVPEESRTTTVSGNTTTDLWGPEQTLVIGVGAASSERAKVVTENGIEVSISLNPFGFLNEVGFTSADSLRSVDATGQGRNYGGTGQAIGSPITNFVTEDVAELPAVNSSGTVVVATETGDRTALATGAKASKSRLAVGRWQNSAPSIFFVDSGTRNVVRATDDGDETVVGMVDAAGVAGIGDFDGDGADELIYGGNSPDSGLSDSINYVDDDGTPVGTGQGYGKSAGIGVGEPADFDDDGTVRVPVVDGSNDILLVDDTGATEKLTQNGQAAKSPLGTVDFDEDGEQEILFVDINGELGIIDNVTEQNDERTLTDDQGNPVTADKDAGAA